MSSGDTKPPDPGARPTPVDLARVVVKPTIAEIPQTTHMALPRVQPTTSVISATAISGQSIFSPSPSHLIVPTAAKTASLRPPIRPLQPTPIISTNIQKIVAGPQVPPQGIKTAPTVVPQVTRNSLIPVQSKQQVQPRSVQLAPTASMIRAPQFSTHVPRGTATVASITAGPKTAGSTPLIRQNTLTGPGVVVTPNHLTTRASAAALNLTRSFAPVTMVEVSKNQQSTNQIQLGIQPSITIESGIRAGGLSQKQTVVGQAAMYQPVVTGEKGSITTTLFKTTGSGLNTAGAAGAISTHTFNKATTTFTPITTSQAQTIVQPISNVPAPQAVTITGKNMPANNPNQFSKLSNPVFVTNKNAVNNVVITTSQRPMRNVSTTQVTTPMGTNISIPVTKVFQQSQPLTVSAPDMDTPQPIGFVTGGTPRLQLPVLNVGQNVQGTTPGTVVLTGDANRNSGAQYAVPAGTYLTYETYTPYFGGPGGSTTPVHLTSGMPGVRTVTPRAQFTTPRPLMVTVDTKNTSTNNVISVTATKSNHNSTIDAATLGTAIHGEVTLPRETTITKLTTPVSNSTDLQTTTYQTSKLSNITDKVITQALATPVNPPTAPLPISVTGITSSSSSSPSSTTSNTNSILQTSTQSSPNRPSILRKRQAASMEHFAATAALNTTTTLPGGSTLIRRDDTNILPQANQEAEDNNVGHQDSGHQNGQVSPRKKPRKQLLQSNEVEGSTNDVKRQENGRIEIPTNLSRPQLYVGPQHGWKSRLNHFVRHSDVRCRDDKKQTVNELANQKSAVQRAHGWKLYHIRGQVEEVETIESDVFHRFNKILESFESVSCNEKNLTLTEDEKVLNKITDLIKGNLQRSKIMQDQVDEVKKQLVKVLDHKSRVLDVIGKHISKRPLKKREKL